MNQPPDVINNLKDYLWYLRGNESLIPVVKDGQYVPLGSLNPEEWAEKVSHWIINHQIPAALEPLSEAEQAALQQIDSGGSDRGRDGDTGYRYEYGSYGSEDGSEAITYIRGDQPDMRYPPDVS